MKKILVLLSVFLFTHLFVNLPAYAEVKKSEEAHSLSPEGQIDGHRAPFADSNNFHVGTVSSSIIYGILDGAGRIFKSKEARTDLRGNCSYGETDKPVAAPCIHVITHLLDEEKKKIASTETNENGDFRFFIPAGKTYYVQVMDRKGRSAYVNKKVGRGDSVSLLLKP